MIKATNVLEFVSCWFFYCFFLSLVSLLASVFTIYHVLFILDHLISLIDRLSGIDQALFLRIILLKSLLEKLMRANFEKESKFSVHNVSHECLLLLLFSESTQRVKVSNEYRDTFPAEIQYETKLKG